MDIFKNSKETNSDNNINCKNMVITNTNDSEKIEPFFESNADPNKKYANNSNNSNLECNNLSNYADIDRLLENEKRQNKLETWNKLDRTVKTQKLHAYAEKYGKEHNLPVKEIRLLKQFFIECLEKNKLQKTKDVCYDKEKQVILSIVSLQFNKTNHSFTLKNIDAKRVSTIKSLTPKRTISEKIRIEST